MPTLNKSHWYDGWFYDFFIAPNQDRLFSVINDIIIPDSTVIDIGCGTGRLSFTISNKVSSILGIDLSIKNIEKAKSNLLKNPNDKITFKHSSLDEIASQNIHFDYAVMTYVIHEINPNERVKLLTLLSNVADKIIIGDYLVPREKGFWNLLNEAVEFLAGEEHYRNFKNYVDMGGIPNLATEASLKILSEIKNKPQTSQLFVLTKKENS